MKKVLIAVLLTNISTFLFSQTIQRQVINSAGGTFSTGGISMTTNIGEAIIGTISNNGISIRQGFLQPNEEELLAPIFHQGNLTFCQGDSVKLSSTYEAGLSFQWILNGSPILGAIDSIFFAKTSGSYRVRVTNGIDTTVSDEKVVSVRSLPLVSIQASGSLQVCKDSSILLTANGASQYVWSNNATLSSIRVGTAGTYSVVGMDTNGCQNTSNPVVVSIVNPVTPTISLSSNSTFCSGDSVVLTSSSITGNFWNNGSTTQSITVKTSGYYKLVSTTQGCISDSSLATVVTVNAKPSTPIISTLGSTTFCSGDSVVLTSSSLSGNLWNDGSTSRSITVKTSGSFSVSNSVNGCLSDSSLATVVTVKSKPSTPSISTMGSTTFCSGDSVILTSTSLLGNSWSNGSTSRSITVKASGSFSVLNSVNGCSSDSSLATVVTVNAKPSTPSISTLGFTTFCSGDSVVLTSSSLSGNLWNNGSTSRSITVKTSGSFSVSNLVNGCLSDSSLATVVTVKSKPSTPSISTLGSTTFCSGDSVILTSSSLLGNSWSNGSTSRSITVKSSGSFSVTSSLNGCLSDSSNRVNILVNSLPANPVVTSIGATNVCNTNVNLQSTSAFKYLWSNGDTSANITAVVSGNYSVIIFDQNGCKSTSNVITVRKFTSVPTNLGSISGDLNPCGVRGTNNSLTYSVVPNSNVLSYTWTLTGGITGVGRLDSNAISVTFPANYTTGGIVRVAAVNSCGTGSPTTIQPKTMAPTTTPVFSQSLVAVCTFRGTGTPITYSIQPISGCGSYQWTVPTNATLVAGQGTTSIQVTFGTLFTGGKISVLGISNCGNTPVRTFDVKLLDKPNVTGLPSICPGDLVTYSVPPVPNSTSYRFNLPTGLSLVSQSSNSAVITNTGSFISGTLSVQVFTSNCGVSQPGSLSLNTAACKSISEEFSLNVFPNPSSGEFQIQSSSELSKVQISLFAADGRLVKRQIIGQLRSQAVNFNDVAEGLYHLELVGVNPENQVYRHQEKLVIKR